VLMLLDNAFVFDRRVHSEAAALVEAGHHVTLIATAKEGLPESETVSGIEVRRRIRPEVFDIKRRAYVTRLARELAARQFDVLHCHDHWMLDLGRRIKRLKPWVRLVYDSHELFRHWPLNLGPRVGLSVRLKARVVRAYCVWRERANARAIDRLVTVNESLARELSSHFRLSAPPIVVRNIPSARAVEGPDRTVRDALGIHEDRRILVCIGARLHRFTLNLEQVMGELQGRADVAVVLIAADHSDLEAYARARDYQNVYFHPFVSPEEVLTKLSGCDVGLVSTWNKRDLSYWYALDNKLFDYVAAGLPVLATAQPEYRAVVEEYRIGVCVNPENPGAYAHGLTRILDEYARWKTSVLRAREELTWDREKRRLLHLYRTLAHEVVS
jgi:glycosyltransferase involved in cell wall biosynthesis